MADLGERSQIILVAAFALGVIFIALAVVVNTAIFTENLATRSESTTGTDALEFRQEVHQSVENMMVSVNSHNSTSTSYTELNTSLDENISDLDNQSGSWTASNGRMGSVEVVDRSLGEKIQNHSATFEDSNGLNNWNLTADGVEDTRGVKINITSNSFLDSSASDGFKLALENSSGDWWNMTVWEDPSASGDVVNVTVEDPSGNTAECGTAIDEPQIDVTAGTLAGKPCPALRMDDGSTFWYGANLTGPYQVRYFNAQKIVGEYELVVREGGTSGPTVGAHPDTILNALYSSKVTVTYETNSIRYETDVRVAPGEVDR